MFYIKNILKKFLLFIFIASFAYNLNAKTLPHMLNKNRKEMYQKLGRTNGSQAKINVISTFFNEIAVLFLDKYRDLSSMRNYNLSKELFTNYLLSKIKTIRNNNRNRNYSEQPLLDALKFMKNNIKNHKYKREQDLESIKYFRSKLKKANMVLRLNQTRNRQPQIRERIVYRNQPPRIEYRDRVVYRNQPPKIEYRDKIVYRDRIVEKPVKKLVEVDPRLILLITEILNLRTLGENAQRRIEQMLLNNQQQLIRLLELQKRMAQEQLQNHQDTIRQLGEQFRNTISNLLLNNNN